MNNEENQLLGTTVPQEWINRFEKLAKKSGRSVSDLVREALAQYIGIDENSVKIFSQLEKSQKEIKSLREKVRETDLYKSQIKDLSVRLAIVEQGMAKLQSQLAGVRDLSRTDSNSRSSGEAWLVDKHTEEDYIDDEPDEVLSDFIPRTIDD